LNEVVINRSERLFQRWLATALVGNLMLLLCMSMWFPGAGFDFDAPHVKLVLGSGLAVVLAILFSIAGLILRRHFELFGGAVASLQILGMIPAVLAIGPWPNGDDGGKMGWSAVVVSLMAILAITGIVHSVLVLIAPRSDRR
jgi:hypothetical protein